MRLVAWRGEQSNFGDELNHILWPRLLPDFFDSDPSSIFLGIGSLLDCRHPRSALKIVAGSGFGGYERPASIDQTWVMHWVRGPLTARMVGLPDKWGIGDPGSLVCCIDGVRNAAGSDIGFMPHFETLGRSDWRRVADLAGMRLIDPTSPVRETLTELMRCRVLIGEALHGVIVADALRIPWIAIQPMAAVHRMKWLDWAGAMGITLRRHPLTRASCWEWVSTSRVVGSGRTMKVLSAFERRLRSACRSSLEMRAAESLARLASVEPQLSSDHALDRSLERMMAKIERIRCDPFASA
jgi:succinoglycan biosynthesis protein ExoV